MLGTEDDLVANVLAVVADAVGQHGATTSFTGSKICDPLVNARLGRELELDGVLSAIAVDEGMPEEAAVLVDAFIGCVRGPGHVAGYRGTGDCEKGERFVV